MRPPARGAAAKGRSQFQLIVIALFSAGLLGGFLLHRSPTVGHTGGFHTTHVDGASEAAGNRRELHLGDTAHKAVQSVSSAASGAASRVPSREGIPEAPQATVSTPPPHVLVGAQDARHPDNIKAMIAGQSHGHEHQSSMLQTFIQGRFDTLLHLGKKTGTTEGKKATDSLQPADAARQQAVAGGKAGDKQVDASGKLATAPPKANAATTSGTSAANTTKKGSAVAVKRVSGGPGTTAPGPGCKKAGAGCGLPGKTIHTLFTSNGSPYQNFQARIMVATWKVVKAQPGGDHMVAMTRILHRTTPDELMEEVDTFRADPLQPECDKWCWFPVADRANAFQQWLDATEKQPDMQKAPWLLLLETDYVWIKPLQVMGDAYDPKVPGLSFAFDYIGPRHNKYVEQMLKEECPTCDPATVPNSGPAPVLARFEDFKAATPLWEKLSKWIETHEEAKKALGWVREMYAWDIGVAAGRLNILNQGPPTTTLIAQPPHDFLPHNASMYHYTWGSVFRDEKGAEFWKFDKRSYVDPKDVYKIPHIPLPPPWKAGWKLHDGNVINQDLYSTLSNMLELMNNASATLPDLTAHAQAVKAKQAELDAQAKTDAAHKVLAKATTK